MCGLSFIIEKRFKSSRNFIKLMNNKVFHRGPDDEGMLSHKNLHFGFRRLSILDLSTAGRQPMQDDKGNIIIFNGEIFNYLELKKELIKSGVSFKTKTDTEVILASYRKWGSQCVTKFNGMWGFVLFDKLQNKVLISRDRFGIKPLYYWSNNDYFVAASEIKQFPVIDGFRAEQDYDTIFQYLSQNQLNISEKTFLKNVFEVPPGSNLMYCLDYNKFKVEKYYDIHDIQVDESITFEEAEDKFSYVDIMNLQIPNKENIISSLSKNLHNIIVQSVYLTAIKHFNITENTRKFCEIPRIFHQNQNENEKFQQNFAKFCEILKKRCKGIEKSQKSEKFSKLLIHFDNLVDLEKCEKMSIWLLP